MAHRSMRHIRPTILELDVTIEFPHPLIGRQSRNFVVTQDCFKTEMSRGADVRLRA